MRGIRARGILQGRLLARRGASWHSRKTSQKVAAAGGAAHDKSAQKLTAKGGKSRNKRRGGLDGAGRAKRGAMVQAVRCGGDDALREQIGGAWRIFGGGLSGRPRVLPLPAAFFPSYGQQEAEKRAPRACKSLAGGEVLRGGENAARAQIGGVMVAMVAGDCLHSSR